MRAHVLGAGREFDTPDVEYVCHSRIKRLIQNESYVCIDTLINSTNESEIGKSINGMNSGHSLK
jgi:hypothetical protein